MKIAGTVEQVKEFSGPYGTMYSVKIGDKVYGFGKIKPSVREGESVEFDATENGKYINANPKTLKVVAAPAAVAQPSTTVSFPSASSTRGKDYLPERERQSIIARQAARNAAINFLVLAKDLEALPLPKTLDKKYDTLRGILDKVTDEFHKDALGLNKDEGVKESTDSDDLAAKAATDKEW